MTKSQDMPAHPNQWGSVNSELATLFKNTAHPDIFIETESHRFKELVQKLTGVSQDSKGKILPAPMLSTNSKKGTAAARIRSDRDCWALKKSGVEVGLQTSAFKLQGRKKFQRKLEIKLGLTDPHNTTRLTGNNYVLSPMTLPPLISSPITPLGPAHPFTSSSTNCCYNSTSTSCNQSSYLEDEEETFCFQGSRISVKREPELLFLFPLHSQTQPNA